MSYKEIESLIEPNNKPLALELLENIISKLPLEISQIIEESFIHKRIPKEYLFSSILFAYCNASGLAFNIKHRGYTNYSNLYFAIIGSRGDIKSPAMSLATAPLNTYDNDKYDNYMMEKKALESNSMPAEQNNRKQLLIQNATIEAAMYTHCKNPYSIGIYIDELSFLIEKMANKNSNEGKDWRTFLLQGNTNHHIDIARKTTESYRLKKSCPSLLGSIQTEFINKLFADGNLESGFIDRILYTTKLTNNNKLSRYKVSDKVITTYNESLNNLLTYRCAIEDENTSLEIFLNKEADELIYNYLQKLIDEQLTLPQQQKEYYAKMQINIYKLVLIAHLIKNSKNNSFQSKITKESVELAISINEFYFLNFKTILAHKSTEIKEKYFLQELIKRAKKNKATQTDITKIFGLSKGYVSKLWNR
ncbi:DUF3987 domain-containing protein [Cellulophaga lytica]|uniref:DUF3987 domain-containing protein n=1 Tax=Cellulophaga lytica TaxID=979 RepID=UPI0026E11BD2|nr:DUF3987 domain-containing protein [Cellulophaga lytica]MDO6852397.1 DUF3987 domain-containing protein [Cellulophaga lytica]